MFKKFILLLVLLLAFMSLSFAVDLTDEIVSYYKLDEISGTLAEDATPNGNDGTANNARVFTSEEAGIINTGADFTQGDDFIDIGILDNSLLNDAHTWSFWVYPESLTTPRYQSFIGSINSVTNTDNSYLIRFDYQQLDIFFRQSVNTRYTYKADYTFTNDEWYHVVIVNDISGNIREVYIDGVSQSIDNGIINTNTNFHTFSEPFYIGAINNRGTPGDFFNGKLDEIAFWGRDLSASEIEDLHNAQKDGFESGQYPFTQEPATTITAEDIWTNVSLQNFTAQIGANTYATTNGNINFTKDVNMTFSEAIFNSVPVENYLFFPNTSIHDAQLILDTGNYTIPDACIMDDNINIFRSEFGIIGQPSNYSYSCPSEFENIIAIVEVSSIINEEYVMFNTNLTNINVTISSQGYFTRSFLNWNTNNSLQAQVLANQYDSTQVVIVNIWDNATIPEAIADIQSTDYQTANIIITAQDYITKTIPDWNISNVLFAQLFEAKTIFITFREEVNNSIKENVTFDLISEGFSQRQNTLNGTFFIENLTPAQYEIRYSLLDEDYRPRSYYLNIPFDSINQANFTLRVMPESISQLFTRRIVDQNALPMASHIFELQRFYTNTSSWNTVERAIISTSGDAVFSAIPNTQGYRYRIFDPDFNLLQTSTAFFLIDSSAEIRVRDVSNLLKGFKSFRQLTSQITISQQGNLLIEYNDPTGNLELICADIKYQFRFNETNSQLCSTETSGTLVFPINQTLPGTWRVDVFGTFAGDRFLVNSDVFRSESVQIFTVLALLVFMGGVAIGATLSFLNPMPGIGFIILLLLAFSPYFLGLIEVSLIATSQVVLVGIILLIILWRYR